MGETITLTMSDGHPKPVYHAINGYGRETVMLRKYVLEASLLKGVQPAVHLGAASGSLHMRLAGFFGIAVKIADDRIELADGNGQAGGRGLAHERGFSAGLARAAQSGNGA